MRNLAVKVPEDVWPEFRVRVQAVYQVALDDRKHDNAAWTTSKPVSHVCNSR